jgi:hypothetical protein
VELDKPVSKVEQMRNAKSLYRSTLNRFTLEHNVLIEKLPHHTSGVTCIVEWMNLEENDQYGTVMMILWNMSDTQAERIVRTLNREAK